MAASANTVVFIICTCVALTTSHQNCNWRKLEYGPNGGGFVDGFVTHGVNNFNGERIVDFGSSGFGNVFDVVMNELHVLNEHGDQEIKPDASTDRSLLLAMGRDLAEILGTTPDETLYNQPYFHVGTLTTSSTNFEDRSIPDAFDEAAVQHPSDLFGKAFFPHSVNLFPTLGEWEEGSGRLEIDCLDGRSTVKVSVCNLLPNAVYTLWQVGVMNPGTDNEAMYWLPAGGLGNVLRTDENGNGRFSTEVPWCPVRECVPAQSVDCDLYFSVFHHSDGLIYGADAAATFWKPIAYPAGIVGSNHLWFPVYGSALQDPLNKYNKKECRRKKK